MDGIDIILPIALAEGGGSGLDEATDTATTTPATEDDGQQAQGVGGCAGGSMQSFIMIAVIFVVFYFLLIRPQQKRQKEHRGLLEALAKGDTVYTQGGIYGKVTNITDNTITLDISADPNKEIRMKILRHAVAGKSTPQADGGAAKDSEAMQQSQRK